MYLLLISLSLSAPGFESEAKSVHFGEFSESTDIVTQNLIAAVSCIRSYSILSMHSFGFDVTTNDDALSERSNEKPESNADSEPKEEKKKESHVSESREKSSFIGYWWSRIWGYSVVLGEDNEITIGEILLLIVSIISGISIAFWISKLVARFLFPWLGMSPGVAIAWRLILRNVLALCFVFIAFQIFRVPITAFAVVGGAAALAIGFGSKDIANNFMSGLILLTEQPIRVNDVILYDTQQCLVTYMGLRSTRLRNLNNHELIVPNNLLIEKLVTNLTLSDKLIRLAVPLEIDRTEPVRAAFSAIRLALDGVEGISTAFAPEIVLKSVDTYYLNFEILFTIEFADLAQLPLIQSRVLTAVAETFPLTSETRTSTDDPSQVEPDKSNCEEEAESPQAVAALTKTRDPQGMDERQLTNEIKRMQAILAGKKK